MSMKDAEAAAACYKQLEALVAGDPSAAVSAAYLSGLATEREACAKLAEEWSKGQDAGNYNQIFAAVSLGIAEAIRGRSVD